MFAKAGSKLFRLWKESLSWTLTHSKGFMEKGKYEGFMPKTTVYWYMHTCICHINMTQHIYDYRCVAAYFMTKTRQTISQACMKWAVWCCPSVPIWRGRANLATYLPISAFPQKQWAHCWPVASVAALTQHQFKELYSFTTSLEWVDLPQQ